MTGFCVTLLMVVHLPDPTVSSARFSRDLQWKVLESTVRIKNTSQQSIATGTVVAKRENYYYVLTAAHAVQKTDELVIELFRRETYPLPSATVNIASVLFDLPDQDLSLVKMVSNQSLECLPIAPPGQRPRRFPVQLLSVGCEDGKAPLVFELTVDAKKVVRRENKELRGFFWESLQAPKPGRSGGALVDEKGYLIGVCAASQNDRGYFTHADEILAALKQQNSGWIWESRQRDEK